MSIEKVKKKRNVAIDFFTENLLKNPQKPYYLWDFEKIKNYGNLDEIAKLLHELQDLNLIFWIKSDKIENNYIFKKNIYISGKLNEVKHERQLEDILSFNEKKKCKTFDETIIDLYDNFIAHIEPDKPFTKSIIELCVEAFRDENGESEDFHNLTCHEIILYILIVTGFCRDLRRITSINHLEDIISYSNAIALFKNLRNKNSTLIKNDLIEINHIDDNSLDISFCLSKKSKRLIGVSNEAEDELTYFEIQDPKGIEKSKLIFDDLFNDKIDKIEKVISSNIKQSEINSIKILFFGDPGTGKTTLTKNLAIKSSRKLLHLNGSKLLSMWADETPKNIDRAFDEYRKLCDSEDRYPILFFDECDQIVTKRTNADNSSYKSDENKTIIRLLRRLDAFEGILIFASNLFNEIDPALNDRFLFKLKFENPDSNIKEKIFEEKFKFLSKYNFSIDRHIDRYEDLNPRQIENIKRKLYLLKYINAQNISIDKLIEEEQLIENKFKRVKIGFN